MVPWYNSSELLKDREAAPPIPPLSHRRKVVKPLRIIVIRDGYQKLFQRKQESLLTKLDGTL